MSRLSDWWRGYSDVDIASVTQKVKDVQLADFIIMTKGEFKAYRGEGMNQIERLPVTDNIYPITIDLVDSFKESEDTFTFRPAMWIQLPVRKK